MPFDIPFYPAAPVPYHFATSTQFDNNDGIRHGVAITRGRYAGLVVSDTGYGIQPPVLPRIWEPFFTTKPIGQGTGVGLSMVYGAVQQSGGFVWEESEPGQGTVMKIHWPELQRRDAEVDRRT